MVLNYWPHTSFSSMRFSLPAYKTASMVLVPGSPCLEPQGACISSKCRPGVQDRAGGPSSPSHSRLPDWIGARKGLTSLNQAWSFDYYIGILIWIYYVCNFSPRVGVLIWGHGLIESMDKNPYFYLGWGKNYMFVVSPYYNVICLSICLTHSTFPVSRITPRTWSGSRNATELVREQLGGRSPRCWEIMVRSFGVLSKR